MSSDHYNQTINEYCEILGRKDAEIAALKEALQNQMQCVGELKQFNHNLKERVQELEVELGYADKSIEAWTENYNILGLLAQKGKVIMETLEAENTRLREELEDAKALINGASEIVEISTVSELWKRKWLQEAKEALGQKEE
jgi:hypothetical protein